MAGDPTAGGLPSPGITAQAADFSAALVHFVLSVSYTHLDVYKRQILSYSLVIIVLGGMGSIKGAAVGALIVGLVDSFSKALVPNFTPTIVFGTVILVLAFKPSGLFGKKA